MSTPTFTPPYFCRIMACLPGHTPVELARFQRPLQTKEWVYWTSPLSKDWEVTIEQPLRKHQHLYSSRYGQAHPHRGNH